MAYVIDEKMPKTLFVQLLMEKANMLKQHLKDTKSNLVMCANIGPNMATFKLYNTKEEDSLKLHATISNFRRYRRTIISIEDTIKLFVKGTLSLLSMMYIPYNHL